MPTIGNEAGDTYVGQEVGPWRHDDQVDARGGSVSDERTTPWREIREKCGRGLDMGPLMGRWRRREEESERTWRLSGRRGRGWPLLWVAVAAHLCVGGSDKIRCDQPCDH